MKRRIAVFLPNWIGDLVMATPALRAIRRHFAGEAEVWGVMRPYARVVLVGSPYLGTVIDFDPRSRDPRSRARHVTAQLRQSQASDALLLTNSLRPACMAWWAGIPHRVGYVRYGRRMLLSPAGRLAPPRDARGRLTPVSAVDYYLELARALGVGTEGAGVRQPELATTADEEHLAAQVWRQFGWSIDEPVIILNTGGAYGAAKRWPNHYFAQLALRLTERYQAKILMLCGPAEQDAAREVTALARHPNVRSLAEQRPSLGLTKACVRRGRLMISTDSGPRHFAAAFGIPCVTIFGPTDPRWSHNYGRGSQTAEIFLDCRPCAKRSCPLGHHRCMNDLTPDALLSHVQSAWQAGSSQTEAA